MAIQTSIIMLLFVTSNLVISDSTDELTRLLSEPETPQSFGENYDPINDRAKRSNDAPAYDQAQGANKDDDEIELVKHLLKSYNKEVRPVINKEDAVQVIFGLAYTQLLDLDEKNQVLVSNVWIRMSYCDDIVFLKNDKGVFKLENNDTYRGNGHCRRWFNHLLTWDPKEFGGIKSINLDPRLLWLPDIVLYNNAEETLGAGQMDQFKTKVILRYDGLNRWFAPTILRSRCAINVEFFPFDDQKCPMRFLSWTYDGLRVNITETSDSADLVSYLTSGEFELLSAKAVRRITKYSCCVEPYPHVTFTIHIRRKTLFYFNNLIVPCFLITALGLLTFILPPATGERVTLVITTLLAMTVFMLMIAEKTPTTSKVTPLIGKFFIASMVIIGLSLIATCIVLNLYECTRAVESVPKPIRTIVLDYLAPFLRVDPPIERKLANLTPAQTTVVGNTQNNACATEINNGNSNNWNFHEVAPNENTQCNQRNTCNLPREISEGISILSERAKQQERFDELAEEWQAVAKVADRFFLIIFLLTITITTIYIFVNRPTPEKV